jgi:hypothetical protein
MQDKTIDLSAPRENLAAYHQLTGLAHGAIADIMDASDILASCRRLFHACEPVFTLSTGTQSP